MTIDVATWTLAQSSIQGALTRPWLLAEERAIGEGYRTALDAAVKRYAAIAQPMSTNGLLEARAKALEAALFAERTARGAAQALGYTCTSGEPCELTPFAPISVLANDQDPTYPNKLNMVAVGQVGMRLGNLVASFGASDPYIRDVVGLASSRLSRDAKVIPRPMSPVPADVEDALSSAILNATRFSTATAVR